MAEIVRATLADEAPILGALEPEDVAGSSESRFLDTSVHGTLAGIHPEPTVGVALGLVRAGKERQAVRLEFELDPDGSLRVTQAKKIARKGARTYAIQRVKLRIPIEMRKKDGAF